MLVRGCFVYSSALLLVCLLAQAQLFAHQLEDPDAPSVSSLAKYPYSAVDPYLSEQLSSQYEWQDKTVVIPITRWIGWLPLMLANGGIEPNEQSVFYQRFGFKVDLKIVQDIDQAMQLFASGQAHVLPATLDQIVYRLDDLTRSPQSSIRLFQVIGWSNGGDVVVTHAPLKAKQSPRHYPLKSTHFSVVPHSPSHFFLLDRLYSNGYFPEHFEIHFVANNKDLIEQFISDPSMKGCAVRSPDFYSIFDSQKAGIADVNLLFSSSESSANRVVADVWGARADFARDHPAIIEGLIRGVFDGIESLNQEPKQASYLFARYFNMLPAEAEAMLNDVVCADYADNLDFLVNLNNPNNLEQTWNRVFKIYQRSGFDLAQRSFDWVLDPRPIERIAPDFINEIENFNSMPSADRMVVELGAEKSEMIWSIPIYFAPTEYHLNGAYDTQLAAVIDSIGEIAKRATAHTIEIIGYGDRSHYLEAKRLGERAFERHAQQIVGLSMQRAEAVQEMLLEHFPHIDKTKVSVKAEGWGQPQKSFALSRRVDVKIKLDLRSDMRR